jgi:spermidine/putrescine transport system ATP-binding protein
MPSDVGDQLLIGVRPEKIELRTREGDSAASGNRLTGGVVVDASFTGVSTQYLVRLPSGRNAVVVAQNLGLGERFPAGTDVDLVWDVDHTFALPPARSVTDGTVVDVRNPAEAGSAPLGAVSG